MNNSFTISAREITREMDEITKAVFEGKVNVNIGTMAISKFKVILQAHKLQLDEARITGKPIVNYLVDMT